MRSKVVWEGEMPEVEREQFTFAKPMDSRAESERVLHDADRTLYQLYDRFKEYPTEDNGRQLTNYLEHYRTAWMNMRARP